VQQILSSMKLTMKIGFVSARQDIYNPIVHAFVDQYSNLETCDFTCLTCSSG